MAKIAAVILNYNDAQASVRAAGRIRGFRNIDRIILADNASTDDSRKTLEAYARSLEKNGSPDEKLRLVFNDKNGGYGYGNNRGVYAAEKEGCDTVLIANPDAVFSEKTVDKMAAALEDGTVAASGALIRGARYTDCAWPLLPFTGELAYAGPLTKRVFRRKISYPRAFFRMLPAPVGAVHGSLVLVKTEDFRQAGGFDEKVFLYCEEKILGRRLAMTGKKTVLTDAVYSHAGSETLRKDGMDAVQRQKLRQESERYYYRTYLQAGPAEMLLARMQQGIVLLETVIGEKLGKL